MTLVGSENEKSSMERRSFFHDFFPLIYLILQIRIRAYHLQGEYVQLEAQHEVNFTMILALNRFARMRRGVFNFLLLDMNK